LSWYLAVAENRRPAKFRIAATLATQLDLAASSEDALWAELERLTPTFLTQWQAIRAGAPLPPPANGTSLLELCRELAYRMLAHCNFCPWDCRVDRRTGAKLGACKLASGARVSTYFHHTGEELFYRGTAGSGTIFFTSCNMRCAFCQNGIRHLVMPNHVECCTYPVLDWIAEHVPAAPVNVMAQFHPDNFCDPGSGKYRDKYAEIARRPTWLEPDDSWRRARQLGLKFETTTFERRAPFGMTAMFGT
jgi:uncharacterized Fe-S radical SAM superfamily protein PflX